MNTWFTSDNHFGHTNILKKFCPTTRQGSNADEMDELMIQRWNADVRPNDLVYCLGDFSFRRGPETGKILDRLMGMKILILGNHEKYLRDLPEKGATGYPHWLDIQDAWFGFIDDIKVQMFHYPIAEWRDMHRGSFHLYGHVHGKRPIIGRSMDVGIDTRPNKDMTLWPWEEVRDTLKNQEVLSHHGD